MLAQWQLMTLCGRPPTAPLYFRTLWRYRNCIIIIIIIIIALFIQNFKEKSAFTLPLRKPCYSVMAVFTQDTHHF